jgi:hypothetical protein
MSGCSLGLIENLNLFERSIVCFRGNARATEDNFLHQISRLGEAVLYSSDLSEKSRSILNVFFRSNLAQILSNETLPNLNKIEKIFCESVYFQHFLSESAVILGTITPFLSFVLSRFHSHCYRDATEVFKVPDFFLKLESDTSDITMKMIREAKDTKEVGGFGRFVDFLTRDIEMISEDIEAILFKLVEGYRFRNGIYKIIDKESKKTAIAFIDHPLKQVRALAQFLLRIHDTDKFIAENDHLIEFYLWEFDQIKKAYKLPEGTTEITEMDWKWIVPDYYKFIDLYQKCQIRGSDLDFDIFQIEFVSSVITELGKNWVLDYINIYEVITKVKDLAKYILKKNSDIKLRGMLASFERDVVSNTIEEIVGIKFANRISVKSTSKTLYPIGGKNVFCASGEEFRILCEFHKLIESHKKHLTSKLCMLEEGVKTVSKKSRARKGAKAETKAKLSASATCEVSAFSEFEKPSISISTDDKKEEEADLEVLRVVEDSSIVRASLPQYEKTFFIHERVLLWTSSTEEALALYDYDESVAGSLPREEMILRHSFPVEMIKYMLHKDFSRRGIWENEKTMHRHWDALIEINTKKYILEVTMNDRDEIYHYYARPRRCLSDIEMVFHSPAEFPPLRTDRVSSEVVQHIEGFIEMNELGSLIYRDEKNGNLFKLIRLSNSF